MTEQRRCANCAATLEGAFCHRCGQRADPPPTGVGYVGWLLSRALGFDSSLVRSLAALVFRPGRLTAEYLEGHRVRYVDPLQLYLVSAAWFFLVHAYRPFVRFDVASRSASSRLGGATATGGMSTASAERLEQQGMSIEVFAERFDAFVNAYLPFLLIGLLAVFVLLIWLMNRRSGRPFVAHAVFTLHWSAFYLVTRGVVRTLPLPEAWNGGIVIGLALISLLYLAVAMRVVYGGGWTSSAIKGLAGVLGFGLLIAVWMASAIGLAVAFA